MLLVVCKDAVVGIGATRPAEKMGLGKLLGWTGSVISSASTRPVFIAYAVGVPAGLMMLWLLLLSDRVKLQKKYRGATIVRQLADATFPLYLFHIPLLMLIAAFVPYDHASSAQKIAALAVVLVASVLIEIPLNRCRVDCCGRGCRCGWSRPLPVG